MRANELDDLSFFLAYRRSFRTEETVDNRRMV